MPGPSPAPQARRAAALSVLVLLLAGGCAGLHGRSAPAPVDVAWPDQGHDHIPVPAFPHAPYQSQPPTSGPHTPFITRWGVHDKPVPDEVLVHNLEHGGVVMGHRCADCPDVVAELKALAEGYPMVVIAPNPALPAPIVLTAWQHSLAVERLDAPARTAIAAFLQHHHGVDHHLGGPHAAAPAPTVPEPDPGADPGPVPNQ